MAAVASSPHTTTVAGTSGTSDQSRGRNEPARSQGARLRTTSGRTSSESATMCPPAPSDRHRARAAGACRLVRGILERRCAAVAGALMVSVVLGVFLAACGQRPQAAVREEDGMFVMDDFESGALIGWRAVGGGSGGWFVYTDGSKAPDPARSDANVAFVVPDPPRGRFAAVSDTNGPGTRI